MLDINALKQLLHQKSLTNTDRLLLCMAVDDFSIKPVSEIISIAVRAGHNKAKSWNASSYLSRSNGMAIRVSEGWELTNEGKHRCSTLAGSVISLMPPKIAANLRGNLAKISNQDTADFVDEAIRCFESGMLRSAVVLSWVGAMSLLYDYVVYNHLIDFNIEAQKSNPKWKPAKNKDDLTKMKEHDFLQILPAISVLGKSVKDELEGCLKFRNGCGHPNSLRIGESRVTGHIEILILNVFTKF